MWSKPVGWIYRIDSCRYLYCVCALYAHHASIAPCRFSPFPPCLSLACCCCIFVVFDNEGLHRLQSNCTPIYGIARCTPNETTAHTQETNPTARPHVLIIWCQYRSDTLGFTCTLATMISTGGAFPVAILFEFQPQWTMWTYRRCHKKNNINCRRVGVTLCFAISIPCILLSFCKKQIIFSRKHTIDMSLSCKMPALHCILWRRRQCIHSNKNKR